MKRREFITLLGGRLPATGNAGGRFPERPITRIGRESGGGVPGTAWSMKRHAGAVLAISIWYFAFCLAVLIVWAEWTVAASAREFCFLLANCPKV